MGSMPFTTEVCPTCGSPLALIVDMDVNANVAASEIGQWHQKIDPDVFNPDGWNQVLLNFALSVQLPGYVVRWEHGQHTSMLHIEQVYPERMEYTLSPNQFGVILATLKTVHRCPPETSEEVIF